MNRIVFDIETLAYPLDNFDEEQQEYLMKFARTDEEKTEALLKMNLSPFTAQVLAIGMLNPDTHQGRVLYSAPKRDAWHSDDKKIEFVACSEKEMLEKFWETILHFKQFITFNGRSFDCPFLLLRSSMLNVKPTRNLLPYRYGSTEHCDLLEQLTFYGAMRKYSLDFYCKAYGIKSPKSEGITGLDMGMLYKAERFDDIAKYCIGDVVATAELFNRWHANLHFEK